jgi:hypothetical protein
LRGKKQVFVWSANRRGKVLAVKATGGGRTELEDIFFLKDVLKYCSKKETNPSSADHGLWYPPPALGTPLV